RRRSAADHAAGRGRAQPRRAGRSGDAHLPAEEQGHRPRADLHRSPGPPDASALAMVDQPLHFTPPPPPRTPGQPSERLIIVSGLSGAGKTVALRTLEDLDYYCVDNLPTALLPQFIEAVREHGRYPRLAVGVDVRNRHDDLQKLPAILARIAHLGLAYQLVFLDTRDDVLLKRFSDTRRRHPLTHDGLALNDAIVLERKLLRPLV